MIPNTMWCTWVPPLVSTFPGHQLTPARIMWVLVRMNANVTRKATYRSSSGCLPESTIARW